jgi:hypothetical protein
MTFSNLAFRTRIGKKEGCILLGQPSINEKHTYMVGAIKEPKLLA